MHNIFLKLCLIFLITFISCQDSAKRESSKSIETQQLSGNIVSISVDLLVPTKILLVQNKLVVFENTQENMFKVFSTDNFKHLYSWGRMGGAPNEFSFIDDNSLQVYKNTIEILDKFTVKKVKVYDDSLHIFDKVILKDFQIPLNRLKKINDSIYYADSPIEETSDFEHLIINTGKNNTVIGSFGNYPQEVNLNNNNNISRYQTYLKTSTSAKGKFAVFYLYFNKLKIYNQQGVLEKEIEIKGNKVVNFDLEKRNDNMITYAEAFATDDYIYALYAGIAKKQIEENIDGYQPQLHVFNWQGELIAKYIVPFPATSFVIDADNTNLYAVSFFKLNELFHGELNFTSEIDSDLKFSNFSNDFYQINFFEGWKFSQATPEGEKNTLHDKNEGKVNYNILIAPGGSRLSFANIHLQLTKSASHIEEYTAKHLSQLKNSSDIVEVAFNEKLIHGNSVNIASIKMKSTSPEGTESIFFSSHWWWPINENEIFQIKLSASEDKFDKYHKAIPVLIESFDLK